MNSVTVSVPLRGFVVFNSHEHRRPERSHEVSVPLRGFVVFNFEK